MNAANLQRSDRLVRQDEVKKKLHYDAVSGEMYWKVGKRGMYAARLRANPAYGYHENHGARRE